MYGLPTTPDASKPTAGRRLVPVACRRRLAAGFQSRPTVELFVLMMVAGLLVRTWLLEGLFVPLVTSGGSMAGTLVGRHREVICADCGHRFDCGADVCPVSPRAVCPNCLWPENDLRARPDLAGDRVLVDKSIFQFRPPRRWEVVAFRHPEQAGRTVVKRVAGLPGESIQIRHGDLYADGRIQRKTLPQQRALAVPVYDAEFPPPLEPSLPPRWQADRPDTSWDSADGRFTHPAVPDEESIDWLTYGHWHRLGGRPGQTCPGPVRDNCGYNQTRPRRIEDLHPVADLLLSFRLVKTFGRGLLVVRATDGRTEFQARIDPQRRRYEVSADGRAIAAGSGKLPRKTGELAVEMSLFDRQLLLAFDGRPVVTYPCVCSDRPLRPSCRPLAIGSLGLGLEIRGLRVSRDVYYTRPLGPEARWGLDNPVRLGPEEYYVLGDNSPVSQDSRTWPGGPAVPDNFLVGKPLAVLFAARRVQLGGWHFQVPDLTKMRYIH